MPCYSIILNQVDLKLVDKETLFNAIIQLADKGSVVLRGDYIGFRYQYKPMSITKGVLSCPQGMESTADLIKQAYSGQVIEKAASRFGWVLRQVDIHYKLEPERREV